MRIMLICAAGMSTSLLVKRMQEAATKKGIDAEIFACPEMEIFSQYEGSDIILLAPQVRFIKKKLVERIGDSIPVNVIDMRLYGLIKGKEILDIALKEIQK